MPDPILTQEIITKEAVRLFKNIHVYVSRQETWYKRVWWKILSYFSYFRW